MTNGESFKLVTESEREGGVEVCVDRHWGRACHSSQEDIAGAVCSEMEFSGICHSNKFAQKEPTCTHTQPT